MQFYDLVRVNWQNRNKMRNFLTIALLAFTIQSTAQYVETTTDSSPIRKNQFGAILNPAVAIALSSDPSGLRYGLNYKRMMDNSRRMKFGLSYDGFTQNDSNHGDPIASTDSSVVFVKQMFSYDYGEFRVGMEWSDFTAKHDAIYGLDLLVGYHVSHDEIHRREVGYTSTNESLIPQTRFIQDSLAVNYVQKALVLGLAPQLGYRVLMKERWELQLTSTMEFAYYAPTSESGKRDPNMERMANSISFRMRLLDVSLAYSF